MLRNEVCRRFPERALNRRVAKLDPARIGSLVPFTAGHLVGYGYAVITTKNSQTIAAGNGVKKLGPKEGRTIHVGNARLTWKATGADTGYATSLYEADLAPGIGMPVHSHPYAEVFYVIAGHTDFLQIDEHGQEEWLRCGPGDTLIIPVNALHAFHNRTEKPSRFISSSVYYHEVLFDS